METQKYGWASTNTLCVSLDNFMHDLPSDWVMKGHGDGPRSWTFSGQLIGLRKLDLTQFIRFEAIYFVESNVFLLLTSINTNKVISKLNKIQNNIQSIILILSWTRCELGILKLTGLVNLCTQSYQLVGQLKQPLNKPLITLSIFWDSAQLQHATLTPLCTRASQHIRNSQLGKLYLTCTWQAKNKNYFIYISKSETFCSKNCVVKWKENLIWRELGSQTRQYNS